jgi:hypothetical protein
MREIAMTDTRSESSPRVRGRRRTILIRPAYQIRVAATVLFSVLLYSLLFGVLIFYPLHQEFVASASLEQQARIARVALDLHARLWPSVLVIAVLVAVQSFFVTHRIVGPAFHVGRVLHALAAGDVHARARLRRWDRLKELEAATNALGDALASRHKQQAERATRLCAAVAATRQRLDGWPNAPAELRSALAEVERIASEHVDA